MPDMLRSIRFPALITMVAAAAVLAACANDATAPSEVEFGKGATTNPDTGLVRCKPQPYAVKSALIGPDGGAIKIGHNEFKVPQGALNETVLITMELPSDTVKSVRFSPEGLSFNPAALPELKLDYKGCPKGTGKGAKVVYTTEQLQVIEVLPSSDDALNEEVDANLEHFSRYAVYY
jgi:hypothetical protein